MAKDGPPFLFRLSEKAPPLLKQCLEAKGWVEAGENDVWNLYWKCGRFKLSDYAASTKLSRINHFPKSTLITKKDHLLRHLRKMKTIHGSHVYDFFPESYMLPTEYTKFVKSYAETEGDGKTLWICKPADLSRGRKIFLVRDLSDLAYDCQSVVQKYIPDPLLIGGYKFDLRLYVLVSSFHPLLVYLYQDGLVRFGTEKYDPSDIHNMYSHLTNASINKMAPEYEREKETVGAGSKWSLETLREYFKKNNMEDEFLWERIKQVILMTLVILMPVVPKTEGCFELFGFDILIDSGFKPWLIEVNMSPALRADCECDERVKEPLLTDLLTIIMDEANDERRFLSQTKTSQPAGRNRPTESSRARRTPSAVTGARGAGRGRGSRLGMSASYGGSNGAGRGSGAGVTLGRLPGREPAAAVVATSTSTTSSPSSRQPSSIATGPEQPLAEEITPAVCGGKGEPGDSDAHRSQHGCDGKAGASGRPQSSGPRSGRTAASTASGPGSARKGGAPLTAAFSDKSSSSAAPASAKQPRNSKKAQGKSGDNVYSDPREEDFMQRVGKFEKIFPFSKCCEEASYRISCFEDCQHLQSESVKDVISEIKRLAPRLRKLERAVALGSSGGPGVGGGSLAPFSTRGGSSLRVVDTGVISTTHTQSHTHRFSGRSSTDALSGSGFNPFPSSSFGESCESPLGSDASGLGGSIDSEREKRGAATLAAGTALHHTDELGGKLPDPDIEGNGCHPDAVRGPGVASTASGRRRSVSREVGSPKPGRSQRRTRTHQDVERLGTSSSLSAPHHAHPGSEYPGPSGRTRAPASVAGGAARQARRGSSSRVVHSGAPVLSFVRRMSTSSLGR
eukprot:Rmarinus@m.19413